MCAENVRPLGLISNAKRLIVLVLAMGTLPGGYCREVISIAAIAVEHERAMASQACRPTSTLQNSPTMPPTRFPPTTRSHKACVIVPISAAHSMQATDIVACLCSCCAQAFELLLSQQDKSGSGRTLRFETALHMREPSACSEMCL